MTIQQWNAHSSHVNEHISWPATKKEIYEACKGEDVEPSVLEEIKMKLQDGGKKYTLKEAKKLLVTA